MEGWDWAATLKVKGVRSTYEFLSFPREEMVRELPRNPALFVLVEKWREWSRRQILSLEEAQSVLRNLKKLSKLA
jgi:hypothetical protein